ncbi:MAG: hypothetical protein WAM65_13650 [Candidatus Korobacteraceae bacterium]
MLGFLVMPALLCAQHETITIKGSSRGSKNSAGDRVFVYGDLEGHSVVLRCVLAHSDCKELPRGEYEIDRLLDGEGAYKDCPNVDIYRIGAERSKEEPLGEYCMRGE